MPATQIPGTNITYGWQEREDGWSAGMNTNMVVLGYLARGSVISRSVVETPSDPAEGDAYIVPADAIGPWGEWPHHVAIFLSGAWIYIEPFRVPMLVEDEGFHVYWDGVSYRMIKGTEPIAEIEKLVHEAEGYRDESAMLNADTEILRDETLVSESVAADRADDAALSAEQAQEAVASLNLPAIEPGDAGKSLIVNDAEDGYRLGAPIDYEEASVNLSGHGQFGAGTLHCVRTGRQVVVASIGDSPPGFTSSRKSATASDVLPYSMRPAGDVANTFSASLDEVTPNVWEARVSGGDFSLWSSESSTGPAVHLSVCYCVPDPLAFQFDNATGFAAGEYISDTQNDVLGWSTLDPGAAYGPNLLNESVTLSMDQMSVFCADMLADFSSNATVAHNQQIAMGDFGSQGTGDALVFGYCQVAGLDPYTLRDSAGDIVTTTTSFDDLLAALRATPNPVGHTVTVCPGRISVMQVQGDVPYQVGDQVAALDLQLGGDHLRFSFPVYTFTVRLA